MNFNSGIFLIFLPVVVTVYWLLPHHFRWVWLLGASCFFYMYWKPALIFLIFLTTIVSYTAARLMERFPKRKKAFLTITAVICLGILAYFKYANFFLESAAAVFGLSDLPVLSILLPVGISFYTFQTLSYVIDVYRGDFLAEHHFGYYALFIIFFPQLVAGPIETPGKLLSQLKQKRTFLADDFYLGIRFLLLGFFKKCAVADFIGIYVNTVFSNPESYGPVPLILTGFLFCIQMYCDFSGYSEIAAGCARLLGIRLTQNFNRPYLSQSYSEFFRRWHITLNRWFTSYVYIPLGGNRKGPMRRLLNTIIVFSLCGLWHGARWTYVLWGLYAAFFVCLESLFSKRKTPSGRKTAFVCSPTSILRIVGMFLLFIPSALLFRCDSLSQAGQIAAMLLTGWHGTLTSLPSQLSTMGITADIFIQIFLLIVAMGVLDARIQIKICDTSVTEHSRTNSPCFCVSQMTSFVYLILIIALSWLFLLSNQDTAGFAYFQF